MIYFTFAGNMRHKYFLPLIFLFVVLGCTDKKDIDKLNFLKKGNLAYANNNLKEAIRFYDEAIAKDSLFVDAWNNKGLAQMKQAKYDEAIYSFDRAVEYKPDYGEALLNNARANLAVHQHFAALEQLAQLAEVWPDTSLLYFTQGLIHNEMGRTSMAMADFLKAQKLDSTNAEILVNIANLHYHQHQSDTAIQFLQQALKINANQPHAYNILAMVYAYQNEDENALQAINTAISLDKHDAYFVNNKGYILLRLNRLEGAEENIVQSMKMDPYNGWVYRNLGLLRYAQENYAEAARLLEKGMDIDNNIDNIYADLAAAYYGLGKKIKACEVLSTAPQDEKVASMIRELCN
jgi:tetratricopeptide (TPR) repeat protein